MDSVRYERIQTLFHHAADLPETERRGFLTAECGGDEDLIAVVLAMVAEDVSATSLLERDLADVAHGILRPESALPHHGFEPYRLIRMLGEGGMGVVYLAERTDVGGTVAIKILRDAWLSPARRERFASEQRTLAQLDHPSIARLYDARTLPDGTPWFVMEHVEGVPLTDYCRTRTLSIAERLGLFREVCEAVRHAHRNLVIHRDLKPSNILVKDDGRVKLLDFGISKQLEHLDAPADLTRTGLRLMTPAYAAPEQIRGDRVSINIDIYSLGVILYELLAGQLPFDLSARTPAEAERTVCEQEPEKPSVVARLVAPSRDARAPYASRAEWADLDVLCLTAMHKDPARRYETVDALIHDIDHFLKAEPLQARPDTARYRLGKFARRNSRSVAAAAAVMTTIVGLVVFYTVRLTNARNAAVAETARTQRIQRFMLNLFEGGDKDAGPADTLRVVTLVDRGVQEAQALDAEPTVQAELFQTLGNIYEKLGKLDRGDALLSAALEQRKSLYGADSSQVAESLVARGLLRSEQARFDEAERLVRDGLDMSKRHLPATHPAVAKATFALGRVLEDRGRYDEAVTALEQAIRLQTSSAAETSDLASSVYELANVHFYAGHYEVSESLNQRALTLHRQRYGDQHPTVSDDLINLGAIQYERGHYVEAERFYRQGLAITEAWYGKDHFKTAANLTMLARALNKQSRYDDARDLLRQSLQIRERVYGPDHPSVASALNELGSTALGRGQFDDAEAYFRRMADIYRHVYGENGHYLIGIAVSNLASVYSARNEFAKAEPLYREAIALYTKHQSADHLNTGIARIKLGRALARQHRYVEAEAESSGGYAILHKQMSPTVSWLQRAREDLIEEYEALHEPEKAQKFRTELAATK